jgi:hypothetical protein
MIYSPNLANVRQHKGNPQGLPRTLADMAHPNRPDEGDVQQR